MTLAYYIWDTITRPSRQDGWYGRITNQCGHAFYIGGWVVLLADAWLWAGVAGIVAYLIHEARNVRAGGALSDSAHDAIAVMVGAFLLSWAPAGAIVLALLLFTCAVLVWARNEMRESGY